MSPLVDFTVAGLAAGTTYALVGVGIALVHQVTGIINFAQGEFVMLGALLYALGYEGGLPVSLAISLAVTGTVAAGVAMQVLIIAPARAAGPDRLIMLTIGASILVQGLCLTAFGADQHFAPPFSGESRVQFLTTSFSTQYVWCAVLTAGAVAGLWLLLNRTSWGRMLRATAMDRDTARLMGVSPQAMSLLAFLLAAALAAAAGIVLAPLQPPDATIGVALGLKGFTAAVIGGLGSLFGAVVGGLVVGLVEAGVTGYLSSGYRDVIVFAVLLLTLMLRPHGLLRRSGS
ncbi:branched-chain amino acid ABC transporter permease [Actinoplanes sp. NBRC 101535]|uniref:branched-chain amino acid ABC transporter permease n=1 Tax=Actinoplanes sp. NBRC 101535 TaxID=3032196 RepID=UPI0024A14645|nr:branched-chain amino acid ABC transporter permease [Actinoplanes sp. NBRC 101535]GLY07963.1 branched-chain amino acid ABC transporter permease [Actinoplanes sp. NBRC 101535]